MRFAFFPSLPIPLMLSKTMVRGGLNVALVDNYVHLVASYWGIVSESLEPHAVHSWMHGLGHLSRHAPPVSIPRGRIGEPSAKQAKPYCEARFGSPRRSFGGDVEVEWWLSASITLLLCKKPANTGASWAVTNSRPESYQHRCE